MLEKLKLESLKAMLELTVQIGQIFVVGADHAILKYNKNSLIDRGDSIFDEIYALNTIGLRASFAEDADVIKCYENTKKDNAIFVKVLFKYFI